MAIEVLKNVEVTLGGTVVGKMTKVMIDEKNEPRDITVFGDNAKHTGSGINTWTITMTAFQDFAAAQAYATLLPLKGTNVAILIQKDSTADVSATNPRWSAIGHFLGYSDLNVTVGEEPSIELEFLSAGFVVSRLTVS